MRIKTILKYNIRPKSKDQSRKLSEIVLIKILINKDSKTLTKELPQKIYIISLGYILMGSYTKDIEAGKIFIYPTDTIYGIGCDATNKRSVEKIKKLKERDGQKPLSVIAPSLAWIHEHLIVDFGLSEYLPGPYTVILTKKDPHFLEHVCSNDTLGVRIPNCSFSKEVFETNVPFITTSVNVSGEPFAQSIAQVPQEIMENVDIVIDEGKLQGSPSTLIVDGKKVERD